MDDDRYFDLPALSLYSTLSVRSLRRYLVDKEHPIPHHYIKAAGKGRGRCVVSKREFDAWVRGFDAPAAEPTAMDEKVARAVRSIRGT